MSFLQVGSGQDPDPTWGSDVLANRLTRALVDDHDVPDDLYLGAVETFGEAGVAAMVHLIGHHAGFISWAGPRSAAA